MESLRPVLGQTRRLGRPPLGEADRLTAHIVICASKLFRQQGYAGTSIEAVAAAAQVGKNTIYRRYATKPDLFQAVVDYQMRSVLPSLESVEAEEDAVSSLRRLGLILVEAALKPDGVALQRLVIAEALRFPEIATIYIERAYERAVAIVGDALARICGREPLASEDMVFAAETFIACMAFVPHTYSLLGRTKLGSPEDVSRHVDRALKVFLGGWMQFENQK